MDDVGSIYDDAPPYPRLGAMPRDTFMVWAEKYPARYDNELLDDADMRYVENILGVPIAIAFINLHAGGVIIVGKMDDPASVRYRDRLASFAPAASERNST